MQQIRPNYDSGNDHYAWFLQNRILCRDYRDAPKQKYDKIDRCGTESGSSSWPGPSSPPVRAPRQGSATCFQIVVVKNLNKVHRINGVKSQYGLSAGRNALPETTH
ncbi:Sphingolipid C9-methyltransferase 2 [Epichloe bromicola]|uniref:Sphingolipid C9-methyltransferase 2 n=1 Tax=Epichloe bromicola TaxID=79588 RepID=A0ABQ0CV83_9HYPO